MLTQPGNGTLVEFNSDGSFKYQPNVGYVGEDTFQYAASDGDLQTTATVTINVYNNAPVVGQERYTIRNWQVLEIDAAGVLWNDFDPDGDDIIAVLVTPTTHGSITLHDNGAFEYTPDADYIGEDSFKYEAFDGAEATEMTVFVDVKGLGEVDLAKLQYLDHHTVHYDPGSSLILNTYSSVWTDSVIARTLNPAVVAYSSALATTKNLLKVNAEFKVDNDWSGPAQFRATVTGNYDIGPIAATHDEAAAATHDMLTVTGATAIRNFAVGAAYHDPFEIAWEISVDGGATWHDAGKSSTPLYVTWKTPATTLYRTVVHIGSTNAAGILVQANVINAIWGEYSDNSVTKWNGGSELVYNHETSANLDTLGVTDAPPNTTYELLYYGYGQCNSWTDFFLDALRAQGVTSGAEQNIEATEGDGFLIKNWKWLAANPALGGPVGYDWQFSINVNFDDSLASQGRSAGVSVSGVTDPDQQFTYHAVVVINGVIYDPSYGGKFSDLMAWESASVGGVYDTPYYFPWENSPLFFAKKRSAGDTFCQWQ